MSTRLGQRVDVQISVITPTYNAAGTLPYTLACLDLQTCPHEHIVVDGASTDGTLALLRGRDTRVISEPDRGLYDAMNKGLKLATGDVLGILNADDHYPTPDVLERVAAEFADPAVQATYGDLLYVADDGRGGSRTVRYWRSGPYDADLFYRGWMPPHPTFFVRRDVYERFGGFDPRFGSAADYELMLRFLVRHRVAVAYIPRVLVHMRVGGASNASWTNRWRANRLDRAAWHANGLRCYPWTMVLKPLRKLPQWWRRP